MTGDVEKYRTQYVIATAHRSIKTLCAFTAYLCQGDNDCRKAAIHGGLPKTAQRCLYCEQPTQPTSTEIVQLPRRREVLQTLEAAEELKHNLAIVSAPPGELAV